MLKPTPKLPTSEARHRKALLEEIAELAAGGSTAPEKEIDPSHPQRNTILLFVIIMCRLMEALALRVSVPVKHMDSTIYIYTPRTVLTGLFGYKPTK